VLGSTSSVTGDVNFTVPVTSIKRGYMNGTVLYQDTGVTTAAGTMEFAGTNAYFRLGVTDGTSLKIVNTLTSTTPWTWGNTDRIDAYFYYEVNL
jgi:hypothetical protein